MTPNASRFPTNLLRRAVDGLAAILLAPACGACGQPLDAPTGGAICARCWIAVDHLALAPAASLALPPHITLATAVGPYEGTLKAIVHAMKYERRSTIARHLAARMSAAGGDVLDGADVVIPVPLHPSRERARGFNQARELARHLRLPVLEALTRVRRTPSQADLPAASRAANVRGAFSSNGRVAVEGLTVVLVDDVLTTGATLNACASPLVAAGAKEVRALTAARAALRGVAPRR